MMQEKKIIKRQKSVMNVAISRKKWLVYFKVTENESERKTCKLTVCLVSTKVSGQLEILFSKSDR